jgi:DNA-directed RNA polymerase specialized sigma24 family protein
VPRGVPERSVSGDRLYRATTNHCLNLLRSKLRRLEVQQQEERDTHAFEALSMADRMTLTAVLARVPAHLWLE